MAEAQFIPGQGAGSIIGALNSGFGTTASLMDRAQARRIREAQEQRAADEDQLRTAQEIAFQPVREMQNRFAIAKAKSDLDGFTRTEQLRGDAQQMLPMARSQFDDVMKLADPTERGNAALSWIGKYGHLSNLADISQEFTGKNKIALDVVNHAQATAILKQQFDNSIGLEKQRAVDKEALAKATAEAKAAGAAEQWKAQYGDAKLGDTVIPKDESGNPIPGIVGVLAKNGLQFKNVRAGEAETQSTAEAKAKGQANVKSNESLLAEGERSAPILARVKKGIQLLDEGARTGFAANSESSLKRVAEAFGLEKTDVSSFEELSSILVQQAVTNIPKGQGQVSDNERRLFDQAAASTNKSPEGNRRILNAYAAVLQRNIDIAKIVADGRAKGLKDDAIRNQVNELILNNPVIKDSDIPGGAEKKVGRFTIKEVKEAK